MSPTTRKWLRGAIEILVHGGAAALVVGFTTYSMDITWAQWRQVLLASFMGNGGLRFVQYFVNNPLPPAVETGFVDASGKAITTPAPIVSLSPFSKVQPVVSVDTTATTTK